MPLSGSWISATGLFKNKIKALNTLLKSAEYTITRERVFLLPSKKILLGHCKSGGLYKSGGLNVTTTSLAVVYAPAKRAETLLLFPLLFSVFTP